MPKKDNHGGHMQNYDAATGRWASGKTTDNVSNKYEGSKKVEYTKKENKMPTNDKEENGVKGKMEAIKREKIYQPKEDATLLEKVKELLKITGLNKEELIQAISKLKLEEVAQEHNDQLYEEVEDKQEDDEEEYNAENMINSIIGRDFKLDKDEKLREIIKKKYGKIL